MSEPELIFPHPPDDDPAGRLNRRYRLVLVLMAALILLDQLLVQPPLLRLLTDAPAINLAGRQRMLSQRLAKAALALVAAETGRERDRRREELQSVLAPWSDAHAALRQGRPAPRALGGNSPAIAAAFNAIEPSFAGLQGAARRLVTDRAPESSRADLAAILEHEAEFLPRMERIVGLYEREARARVDHLIVTGWGVTALLLLALAGLGGLVVRPAARLIEDQVATLRATRDALELRVRARTGDLEHAYRDLKREARERSLAEERHVALLEQFSQVGRTTTVGAMASGLAHELNQPLGAIANYAEGCLVALDAPDPPLDAIRGSIDKILATTLRAGAIVSGIRRFVTRHELARAPFEPNRIVAEVEEFFRDDARRRGIAIRLRLAPDLPCLQGDSVQIQQVLVNLVRNALEALSDTQTTDPTIVMETILDPSGGVEFRVTDNGEGISADRRDQVFDAYFSTRASGMGMGLAISQTIVQAHQGRLAVESEPGVRTMFRFTLPAGS